MLNRHAIVLFLGLAAMALLRGFPAHPGGALGTALVCLLLGLMLDDGREGTRANASHVLLAAAAVLLFWNAALDARMGFGAWHLALGEAGIALTAVGLLIEMRAAYRALRLAVLLHALGDALFLGGLVLAFVARSQKPSTVGWVFIAIATLVSGYAAIVNLGLQLGRLRNPQAGWRYRVLSTGDAGLELKTLDGKALVAWNRVQALERIDARHVLLVLPSPLPAELEQAGLPLEELRENAEPQLEDETRLPAKFALVLHEQELGAPLEVAEAALRARIAVRV